LISAKSAVTVLRSPSSATSAESPATRTDDFFGSTGCGAEDEVTGAAHCGQKRVAGAFSAPQFAHLGASGAAYWLQNLDPGEFSLAHSRQRM
jgi:hypothetical protein